LKSAGEGDRRLRSTGEKIGRVGQALAKLEKEKGVRSVRAQRREEPAPLRKREEVSHRQEEIRSREFSNERGKGSNFKDKTNAPNLALQKREKNDVARECTEQPSRGRMSKYRDGQGAKS